MGGACKIVVESNLMADLRELRKISKVVNITSLKAKKLYL